MRAYHILLVASWYPDKDSPVKGCFFRDQAQALHNFGYRVGVLTPVYVSAFAWTRRLLCHRTFTTIEAEGDIHVCRQFLWRGTPFLASLFAKMVWMHPYLNAYGKYAKIHGRPDLLHAHAAVYGGIIATAIKEAENIPFVLTEHSSMYQRNMYRRGQLRLARRAFRNASTRLVVSPALGRTLSAIFGSDFGEWKWCPNLVSNVFTQSDVRTSPRDDGVFRILHIAALEENKAQNILLEAYAGAFGQDTRVELHIGGSGPLRRRLEKQAMRLGIAQATHFLGNLTREEVCGEMLDADVFVLPSHVETFGVVLIEALACGTPVIATRCGGPECIVRDNNGILVPRNNIGALADAMQSMYRNAGSFHRDDIMDDCNARFGKQVFCRRMSRIYRDAIRMHA